MQFLICYTDPGCVKVNDLPLSGTIVDLNTAEDILEFAKQMGSGVIINADKPWWVDNTYDKNGKTRYWIDEDELEDYHAVNCLPENWKQLPWLEIYNGYRE